MDMRYSSVEQGRPSRLDGSYGNSCSMAGGRSMSGGSHSQLSVDEPSGHKMRSKIIMLNAW